jgi:hypothetical protein
VQRTHPHLTLTETELIVNTPSYPDSVSNDLTRADDLAPTDSRASRVGRFAAAVIDARREPLATGIHSAATSLHLKADRLPGGDRVADVAHSAADALEMTADYLRGQDVRGMLSDARSLAKRHPGAVLLTAVAAGFLLARTLSRR